MGTWNQRRAFAGGALAFSLIELTLVMMILAIVLAIGAPRYQNALGRYRAEVAAQRVVTDLHAARRAAEQTSRTQQVVFVPHAHTIAYSSASLDQQRERSHLTRLGEEPYHAEIVSVDFNGELFMSFDGFGKPDHGGTIVIQAHGYRRTISLDAASGRATVR